MVNNGGNDTDDADGDKGDNLLHEYLTLEFLGDVNSGFVRERSE